MLHATHSDWTISSTGTAAPGKEMRLVHTGGAMTVSSLDTAALVESTPAENDATSNMVAMSLPSSYRSESPIATDTSGIDTAVLALGMIGFWMMLLGLAMLSRHFRLVKGPVLSNARANAR